MRLSTSVTLRTVFLSVLALCCARAAGPRPLGNPPQPVSPRKASDGLSAERPQVAATSSPDFAIQVSPSPMMITFDSGSGFEQGEVTLTGANGFLGRVTLSCTTLPLVLDQPQCFFLQNPVTVDASAPAATSTVEVLTTVAGCNPDLCLVKPGSFDGRAGLFAGMGFSTLLLLICFVRMAPSAQRARLLVIVLFCATGFALCGCANKPFAPGSECGPTGFNPGTTAGTYMFTITATSGSLSHSVTVPLIVPPSP